MHKGDGGTAHSATCGRRYHAHNHDQDGEEAPKLVFPQSEESKNGGANVDNEGRHEGPQEDVVPHLTERMQGRGLREADHILD